MSWQDAPLYVRAHDLARDLHARIATWPEPHRLDLGGALCRDSRSILHGVSLALAFPLLRPAHQETADHAVLRLRVTLRLAEDLGLLPTGAAVQLHHDLTDIGRMLGGWRKREDRRQRGLPDEHSISPLSSGGGSPPRPGA